MWKYLICILGIGLASLIGLKTSREGGAEGIRLGGRVPDFSLKTLSGDRVSDQSLQGQVVILNFWSTGCSACLAELPELQQIANSSQAMVIGIALEHGSAQAVRSLLKRRGVTYPVALGDEALFERFDGINIPYTLVLDRLSQVVKIYRGVVTKDSLEKDIRSITERG
jgi:thiol-disulfide isomerase/thioredoxin